MERPAVDQGKEETRPLQWPQHALAVPDPACALLPLPAADVGSTSVDEGDLLATIPPGFPPPQAISLLKHPALAGYRFLQRESSNAYTEKWRVETPAGEVRILHRYFDLNPRQAAEGVARLQTIAHARLANLEFLCGWGSQFLLLSDAHDQTLREVFAGYWQRGMSGVPQLELIGLLRQAAETLDELYEATCLSHLGLNPRSLVVKNGQLYITDYALMQLLWLPKRWLPPLVNPRYAAPELFMGRITPKSDQFSLALIYAELRTGVHPYGRRQPPPFGDADLDLLSSPERAIIQRALNPQAYARFHSCRDLVRALETIPGLTGSPDVGRTGAASGDMGTMSNFEIMALSQQFLHALGRETLGQRQLCEGPGFQYLSEPGQVLEHTFLVRKQLTEFLTQLEAFLARSHASRVDSVDQTLQFTLSGSASRVPYLRRVSCSLRVQLRLRLASHPVHDPLLTVHARLVPVAGQAALHAGVLEKVGVAFLKKLRERNGAIAELRSRQRWECSRPICVLPVYHDLHLLHSVECVGKDISTKGIGFYAPGWLPAAQILVRLPWLTDFADKAIRATVVRCVPRRDGLFEIGAVFE